MMDVDYKNALKLFSVTLLTTLGALAAFKYGEDLDSTRNVAKILGTLGMFIIGFWILLTHVKMRAISRQQNWLIDAVNWNVKRLREHGLDKDVDTQQTPDDGSSNGGRNYWPWGSHDTEHLRHLDAAARKWWTLYDPSDPSTAPTNNMVAEWLQEERGLSKEKAKAIASILRADGLATGPR